MNSDKLPSVLHAPPNSISMERALKQIKDILLHIPVAGIYDIDRVQASVDDIDTMLARIDRT